MSELTDCSLGVDRWRHGEVVTVFARIFHNAHLLGSHSNTHLTGVVAGER